MFCQLHTDILDSPSLPLTVDVCPVLSIDGGSVSYSDDSRIEGTVATYRCDGNLVLVGNEMRTCEPRSVNAGINEEGGAWNGSDPMCGGFTY